MRQTNRRVTKHGRKRPGTIQDKIWVATAVYPAGNKLVVYIDAVTGNVLAETEIEADH